MSMEDYEDEGPDDAMPEPDPPADTTPAGTFTATVAREEMVGLVADRFFAQMFGRHGEGDAVRKAVQKALTRVVRSQAEAEVMRLVGEGVAAAVGDLIKNGWPKTDDYGREAGRVTVGSLVVTYLTHRDNYGDRSTRMEGWVKSITEDAIKKEMGPLLDEAKKHVRRILDEKVGDAIKRALLDGAGLRL